MTNLQLIALPLSISGISWLSEADASPVDIGPGAAIILAIAAVTFILAFLGGKH